MVRSRIAISQRVMVDPNHGEMRDCLDQEWSVWLGSLGIAPVAVPNRVPDAADFCDSFGVAGVFLSGGNNFHGAVYEDPQVEVSDVSVERDATEAALVAYAIEREIPLIGWCRGMQVLQVYFGGKLTSTSTSQVKHVAANHEVQITSERHAALAGASTIRVNSFHDFGVRRAALARPLRELAITREDQFVEAFFHPDLPIVGCQWHPERPNEADGAAFCRALVDDLLFKEKPA